MPRRTPHSATTLATAFGSDLRSVDMLRGSLRSGDTTSDSVAHGNGCFVDAYIFNPLKNGRFVGSVPKFSKDIRHENVIQDRNIRH
jgi:hypothetical protein